eukprot:jgi/Tetstr1/454181/TSEL_041100.t1
MSDALNAYDAAGATLLHHAVLARDLPVVCMLLSAGADPNLRDLSDTGYTPVILAARSGDPRIMHAFRADERSDWHKQDAEMLSAADYLAAATPRPPQSPTRPALRSM